MNKLPFILSIPHGGTAVPKEVKKHLKASQREIFDDADSYTREIFNIEEHVLTVVKANIARAFVDVNRPIHMLPPEFPDGVIKSKTCFEKEIYKDDFFPSKEIQTALLDKYYFPYHQKIDKDSRLRDIVFGFDCHSMVEYGPAISPDPGARRPMVCISNASGQTCDNRLTRLLAQCFQQHFGVDADQVRVNHPFKGGFIINEYGYNPIPWVQIEINRALYLHNEWFDENTLTVESKRLQTLNYLFHRTLTEFSKFI